MDMENSHQLKVSIGGGMVFAANGLIPDILVLKTNCGRKRCQMRIKGEKRKGKSGGYEAVPNEL